MDANEPVGDRPYEMIWVRRTEPGPPNLRFDQLSGWRMLVQGGAQSILQPSRAQNVWDRPVGRLRYRGSGNPASTPRVLIYPSRSVIVPWDATAVDMWVYGNRWDTESKTDTPPVEIHLIFRDQTGKTYDLLMTGIRWKEWWLVHHRLPKALRLPAVLDRIEIVDGWQKDWRELFFDSIRFYREAPLAVPFTPRPRRNLTLFEGQSPGANTGSGTLAFPTREETILPQQTGGPFRNEVVVSSPGVYAFKYIGQDCSISYFFESGLGLNDLRAEVDGVTAAFAISFEPTDG